MMIEVMADLYHPNQLAYIKKRFIGEGIKLIDGIIEYVKEKRLSGYMLAVDFLKAFDSYEWEFWERVLRVFGFPECFIQLLKRHYRNIVSCVVNGGSSTNYFSIKRGIKQGDPPSGLIFILGIELFAINVRSDRMIEGIEINRQEVKLTAFADDVNHFLKNIRSVENVLFTLEKFGEISGLVCNISKCEAMALGNSTEQVIKYNGIEIKWVKKMKITGITFGNKSEENRKEDVDDAISKMKTQLQIWSGRNLSVLGKIQIVKTFGISQILYISNMVSLKKEEIETIQRIVAKFIWDDKTPKVKQTAMIAEYEHGGLKYPHIQAIIDTQKIMWIKRYFCSPFHPWKLIFDWQMEKIGGKSIFLDTNLNVSKLNQWGLSDFYMDIISAWGSFNRKSISSGNVLHQSLFFNTNIKHPIDQTARHKIFMKMGIVQVSDITRRNRLMNFTEIKIEKNLQDSDYLTYRGLTSALPIGIKEQLATAEVHTDWEQNIIRSLEKKNSKTVYRKLLKEIIERPTSEQKFQIEYLIGDTNAWGNIYKLPFMVTIDTKTRVFQFKITHNIYYTNKKLSMLKIRQTPECSFCDEHEETLKHLFLECKYVKTIWNDLQNLCNVSFSDNDKLFGFYQNVDDKSYDVLSHITIIVKQCIHRSRLAPKIPTFQEVKAKIIETEQTERDIALRNAKLEKHLNKWARLRLSLVT